MATKLHCSLCGPDQPCTGHVGLTRALRAVSGDGSTTWPHTPRLTVRHSVTLHVERVRVEDVELCLGEGADAYVVVAAFTRVLRWREDPSAYLEDPAEDIALFTNAGGWVPAAVLELPAFSGLQTQVRRWCERNPLDLRTLP